MRLYARSKVERRDAASSAVEPEAHAHQAISEALYNFLQARKTPANVDLVDRWSVAMETQVNVIAGDGEPVAGKKSTWSNGSDTWHSIRIQECRHRPDVGRLQDRLSL